MFRPSAGEIDAICRNQDWDDISPISHYCRFKSILHAVGADDQLQNAMIQYILNGLRELFQRIQPCHQFVQPHLAAGNGIHRSTELMHLAVGGVILQLIPIEIRRIDGDVLIILGGAELQQSSLLLQKLEAVRQDRGAARWHPQLRPRHKGSAQRQPFYGSPGPSGP